MSDASRMRSLLRNRCPAPACESAWAASRLDLAGKLLPDVASALRPRRCSPLADYIVYHNKTLQNERLNGHMKNTSYQQADVTEMEIAENSYDFVFSNWRVAGAARRCSPALPASSLPRKSRSRAAGDFCCSLACVSLRMAVQ